MKAITLNFKLNDMHDVTQGAEPMQWPVKRRAEIKGRTQVKQKASKRTREFKSR